MAVTDTNGTNGTSNGSNGSHAASSLDFTIFHNIIDGKPSRTSKTRHNINPSTLEANPEVPVSTQEDVDKAVEAAKAAFPAWAALSWEERREKINAYGDALQQNAEEFARLLVREQGKPVSRSTGVTLTWHILADSSCHMAGARLDGPL